MRSFVGIFVFLSTALASVLAEPPQWPQFRGPAGSGVAPRQRKAANPDWAKQEC